MKKLVYLSIGLMMAVFVLSCDDEFLFPRIHDDNDPDTTQQAGILGDTLFIENLSGYVQKGPFINGSSITISELKNNLSPTGINYNTQIVDNKGTYGIKDIKFTSNYVELKATGFYFNEVAGQKSSAQLTLYALSDLTDTTSLNVNVLSNLEKRRVEYLVSEGYSFREAKQKAQKEILAIFNIDPDTIRDSELLDISKDGEDNAILLAVSVILQGNRPEADLSELMANINTDLREDGILNSESTGSELINHCKYLDLGNIRQNLVNRYNNLGTEAIIPDFEKYILKFIDSTEFVFTNNIEYPEFSNYGENILFGEKDTFIARKDYSMSAALPVGTSLKIVMKRGMWYYNLMPNGPVNWNITTYDFSTRMQTFTAMEDGKNCDLTIMFDPPENQGDLTIEYYENGATTPTKIKHLTITNSDGGIPVPPENDSTLYPFSTETGLNILSPLNDTFYFDSTYAMAFNLVQADSIGITLEGGTWEYGIIPAIQECWYIFDYDSYYKSQCFKFDMPMMEETKIWFRFTGADYQQPVMIYYKEYYSGELYEWSRSVTILPF
ncbi:MAG TPA: hypothetical protein VJ346_09820 [Bacteroidales bacterium]|nr:hypothetical protein [Bacteroidales bacterium]